jgi:phage tail-like protein
MAVLRDRPYGNSNFLVDFGEGDSRSMTAGFAEVIFPQFTSPFTPQFTSNHAGPGPDAPIDSQVAEPANATACNRLVLKRGLIGALDLYEWWNSARHGAAPKRRTVKIELLSEDLTTVVLTWHFRNAYPVYLSYSPLRAVDGGIVMESVELAFESVEMS